MLTVISSQRGYYSEAIIEIGTTIKKVKIKEKSEQPYTDNSQL